MGNMRLLLPYLARYRIRIAAGIISIAAATIASLAQPFYLKDGINAIIAHFGAKGPHPPSLAPLGGFVVLFIVSAGAQSLFSFFQRSTINRVSRYMEYDLRQEMFLHLQALDQGFYNQMHTGDLMARLTNDLNAVRQFIGMGVISLIQTALMLVGVIAAMFIFINWKLTLISMALMPFTSIMMVLIGRRMQARYRAVQDQYGAISTYAQESFSGIRVIKAFVQEQLEGKAFSRENDEYVCRSMKYVKLSGILWPLMTLVVGITAALILFFGGEEVVQHQIDLGQLVQFNAYLGLLTFPLIALGWTMNMYQQSAASMQRIAEVMNRKPMIRDTGHTLPIENIKGEVEFREVSVSYGDQQVLHGVSFTIPLGGTTAIVGRTGAGKSTLVNMIPRVLEPDEGMVLIDGVDVRRIPLAVLRRSIGYASQDTFLFSTTLRENVGFGVNNPTEHYLMHAVDVSRLSKDLEQFPDGLETVIGERGVSLSGGQKQRTSMARAVARDPEILILDDAMSSVDTQTQSEILYRIRQVMRDRTSIIISQRVSTIKDADEIIVLDDGRVLERGNHMELLNHDGMYARMYRRELLQQELEVEEEAVSA